jgi:hypothetical protein
MKALQAIRTSPLVQQCQRVLNDIYTQHAVGLYWVPGHAGVQGNEIADELARGGSGRTFLPALESLDRIYKEGSVVGWLTSTGQDGKAFSTLKDRL